jgi:adenylate kinase
MPLKKAANQLPLNIILLGDPAAGKATQAAFLVKQFPLYDLDMGKELRKLQAKDKNIRDMLKKTYDQGKTTQTDLVRGIFKQLILGTPQSKGILFDGNPKMIGEAKLIHKWLKEQQRQKVILIYLTVPMSETCKRMANRVEYFKGKYSKRTDDNERALKNRVKYYRTQITQVLTFFQSKYPYKKISGMGTPEEVRVKIEKFVQKHS